MALRILLILALLTAAACATRPEPAASAAPDGPTRRLRLATWNLHDLFDAVDDPYDDEVPSPGQVEAKLDELGAVIRGLDADLVAVQEVENVTLLEALARRTGHRQVILHEGNDTQRGIDVGFMARVPLTGSVTHVADALPRVPGASPNYRFSRDCLEVHVAVPGDLVILVNHLKSQSYGSRQNDAKRQAQAGRVREIVDGLGSTPVAVVGDLNAGPRSRSLEPLLRSPLVDVLAGAAADARVTYESGKNRSTLDYILVNPALALRVVPGSARVEGGPAVAEASDHRPVVVDFQVPDWRSGGAPSRAGEGPGR